MRLSSLLVLLALSCLLAAASSQAVPLPAIPRPAPIAAGAEAEGEGEGSEAEGQGEQGEEPESEPEPEAEEPEAPEACEPEEGEACEEGEGDEAEECVLESASARVAAGPGGRVQVTVRYTASSPWTFALDYGLRGGRGALRLGAARARLHRSGVFHDSLAVAGGQLAKLEAARELTVELHAVGTPASCRARLVSPLRRAGRRYRARAWGRSGGPR